MQYNVIEYNVLPNCPPFLLFARTFFLLFHLADESEI